MTWNVLKTEKDYKAALLRTMELFEATEGTPEDDELALLLVLVRDYEDRHIQLPAADPIAVIKLKMQERGLQAKDLEAIIGSKGHVSSILSGRRALTLKIAARLRTFFNLPAELFLPNAA